VIRRALWREELDEIDDLEAIRAKQANEIACAGMELDARIVIGPLEPVHVALGALQALLHPPGVGHAEHREGRIPEEDELSPAP